MLCVQEDGSHWIPWLVPYDQGIARAFRECSIAYKPWVRQQFSESGQMFMAYEAPAGWSVLQDQGQWFFVNALGRKRFALVRNEVINGRWSITELDGRELFEYSRESFIIK